MKTTEAIRNAVEFIESLGYTAGDIRAGLIQAVRDVEMLEDACMDALSKANHLAMSVTPRHTPCEYRKKLSFAVSLSRDRKIMGDLKTEAELEKLLDARECAQQDDNAELP